jgi:hypothetical protein
VFGRGRKCESIHQGSLYRRLVKEHWEIFSQLPTKLRHEYIKNNIVMVLVMRGSRFIARDGPSMSLLTVGNPQQYKLICHKIQRALLNEKKRQEASRVY